VFPEKRQKEAEGESGRGRQTEANRGSSREADELVSHTSIPYAAAC